LLEVVTRESLEEQNSRCCSKVDACTAPTLTPWA
jgi:hypothetical protein